MHPKTAYQEIVGAIEANGEIEACNDVITWLKAACTARGGGGAQNGLPSVHHTYTSLHLPGEVYRYMTAKVMADLPALGGAAGGGIGGTSVETLATALRLLGAARGAGADGVGGTGTASKTVVDTYKETYPTLLKYCNVAAATDVAAVWTRLANCHKSEQHTVLTQELHKVCLARNLSAKLYAPIITTTLKQMVVGFQFAGHGADDLTSGCQPFLVSFSGTDHHYMALAAASVGNQLSQGGAECQFGRLSNYKGAREG